MPKPAKVPTGRALDPRLRAARPKFKAAHRASREAQALADPTRFELAMVLEAEYRSRTPEAMQGGLTGSELCEIVDGERTGISRHLRVLADAGLAEYRPFAGRRYYSLTKRGRELTRLLNEAGH